MANKTMEMIKLSKERFHPNWNVLYSRMEKSMRSPKTWKRDPIKKFWIITRPFLIKGLIFGFRLGDTKYSIPINSRQRAAAKITTPKFSQKLIRKLELVSYFSNTLGTSLSGNFSCVESGRSGVRPRDMKLDSQVWRATWSSSEYEILKYLICVKIFPPIAADKLIALPFDKRFAAWVAPELINWESSKASFNVSENSMTMKD